MKINWVTFFLWLSIIGAIGLIIIVENRLAVLEEKVDTLVTMGQLQTIINEGQGVINREVVTYIKEN